MNNLAISMSDIDRILKLFRERGDSEYGGEAVTQQEHALQCALLAEQENADSCLITAALLHDVGHLLHALPDDAPDQGIDDNHEDLGCRFLSRIFGPAVSEPVRLHVAAKRFLCATDAEYHSLLSEPSVVSLQLQGGPMTPEEAEEFRQNPFCSDAVRLRRWDDTAKVVDLQTPSLEHYVPHIEAAAGKGQPS